MICAQVRVQKRTSIHLRGGAAQAQLFPKLKLMRQSAKRHWDSDILALVAAMAVEHAS
jgi:hypothetical protein